MYPSNVILMVSLKIESKVKLASSRSPGPLLSVLRRRTHLNRPVCLEGPLIICGSWDVTVMFLLLFFGKFNF